MKKRNDDDAAEIGLEDDDHDLLLLDIDDWDELSEEELRGYYDGLEY